MSQNIFNSINAATTSGTQLAQILNDFKDALVSGLSGATRPANIQAGGGWIDTTNAPSYWIYKVYTGSVDAEVFRVNLSTGKASFTGTDSSFEISRISADSVGPIAKFIKQRIASSGQVKLGDIVGQLQFIGRADDASNPVVANLKIVASEDQTSTAQGAYVAIEATAVGTAAAVEIARFIDGKLGVGTQAPDVALHVKSSTGIKAEQSADDANGAFMSMEKSRLAGTGVGHRPGATAAASA